MADYISRDAAIEKIRVAGCTDCGGSSYTICGFCDFENAARLVNGLPTADVEPVRHGRWGKKQGGFWEFAACSLYGEKTPTVGITPNYCPNCGTKMDLEDENHENFSM